MSTRAKATSASSRANSGALPLSKDIGTVAVVGPNAADPRVLLGNYHGMPSRSVTPLDGIRARVSPQTRVLYAEGCKLQGLTDSGLGSAGNLSEARSVASRADVVIVCLGLNADIEGEQGTLRPPKPRVTSST
jgi:beta-glucosidase